MRHSQAGEQFPPSGRAFPDQTRYRDSEHEVTLNSGLNIDYPMKMTKSRVRLEAQLFSLRVDAGRGLYENKLYFRRFLNWMVLGSFSTRGPFVTREILFSMTRLLYQSGLLGK